MRDKFTIYDHERWEPNPHWGRPLRFLTRHVDINEGSARNPPPASWGLPAALTLKSECFDPVRGAMIVNEGDHGLNRRSSSA